MTAIMWRMAIKRGVVKEHWRLNEKNGQYDEPRLRARMLDRFHNGICANAADWKRSDTCFQYLPAGPVCRVNPGATNSPTYGSADSRTDQFSDPLQQKIFAVGKQLSLSPDQLAQLKDSLKADRNQKAEIAKTIQDTRKALAEALANGDTFLDSEIEALAAANAKAQEHELKLWAKLNAILTPNQQRQFLTMATPLSGAAEPPQIAHGQYPSRSPN
jgi:Spy/CpxP family protein refolding chaperone